MKYINNIKKLLKNKKRLMIYLKFDIKSEDMIFLNKFFKNKYPNTNNFDYHPQCTISFLKLEKIVSSKIDGSKLQFKFK